LNSSSSFKENFSVFWKQVLQLFTKHPNTALPLSRNIFTLINPGEKYLNIEKPMN